MNNITEIKAKINLHLNLIGKQDEEIMNSMSF